jgi:hypothetical protein
MDILLALLIFAIGFLLFSAWQLLRSKHGMVASSRTAAGDIGASADRYVNGSEPRRGLKRISPDQFLEVLTGSNDLLLIDLRPADQDAPLPVPAPHIVRVHPHELQKILRQLPEDRSAVFYGASDLTVFLIMTGLHLRGSAPLYLLRPEPSQKEAA